jgi:aspartyl-tRNA(Asn)/glutamyl-tRNA(Gln) amidotransferase subunit A
MPSDRAAALEAAIKQLEKLGAKISEVALPGAETAQDQCAVMIYCDACDVHRERMKDPSKWAPQTIERLKLGLEWTGVDYAAAVRAKETWMRTLAKTFDKVDVLLTPTIPVDPPAHAEDRSLWLATKAVAQNTYNGAFGHIPGLAVPCGFSKAGFPVSMQLEAAWWKEPLLLRIAHAYQQATDWHLARPKLPRA